MYSYEKASKATLTRGKLIRAAAQCLAEYGDKGTTFQRVAEICGVSHALVVHYFKTRDQIFDAVLEDIIARARVFTAEFLERDKDPAVQLRAYLRESLKFFRSEPEIPRIYLTLYYFSGYNPKYKAINSQIKRGAVERLTEIIERGISDGQFQCTSSAVAARTIHNSLVGLYLCSITESQPLPDSTALKTLEAMCFSLLHFSEPIEPTGP